MTLAALGQGRYRLEGVLGRGGMATVYLARDEELDRPVAVKLVDEALATDDTARRRLLSEARLAARLAHPGIVRIYDAGEADGRPYIVMEHVNGPTLAEELATRGPLPPAEVVHIGQQVCAALAHARAAGLVHRDVKPHNLLRAEDGTVKLADFGIARAVDATHLTLAGTVLGTAAYLAPEQAAGEEVGPPADIYALGAALYELLTGRPPHQAATLAELVARHAAGRVEPPSRIRADIPAVLDAAILACLRTNPAERPSPDELAVGLGAALTDEPATIPLQRARPRLRWRPPQRLALLAAAAVLAAGAGLGFALSGGDESDEVPAARTGVAPIPSTDDPAGLARELARWLREQSASTP